MTSVTPMVFGKPLASLWRLGRRISTLPNLTDSSALRAARPAVWMSDVCERRNRGGGKLHRHRAGLVPSVDLGEQGRPVGQTAILSRPHQLFHCGRLERETFVDVALAIFDHRGAGRAGFSQGAGGFRALEPAAAVLLRKRPLLALVAFAALARQKEVVDKAEHRPRIGVHRDHRMKGQPDAFLVHPQGRGVLNGEHVPAGDLGASARPGRRHHLVRRHLGIVEKPGNPHLARRSPPSPRTLTPLPPCATSRSYKKAPLTWGVSSQARSFRHLCMLLWRLDPKREPVFAMQP